MNIIQLILELTVGRLVLGLPKRDLEIINAILKRHYGETTNAEVQEEDNQPDDL